MGISRQIIATERIADAIHLLRGQRVMLDFDLAALYGVSTKVLNQAKRRHGSRFPHDFTFRLTAEEVSILRSQIVTSRSQDPRNRGIKSNWSRQVINPKKHGGRRYRPYAFTEQGVAMLSSILNSERAVRVNIAIMRAFVKLRGVLETNRELARKFAELERRVGKHDETIDAILEAIRQLMAPPEKPRREIGFHVRETAPRYRTRKS